MEQISLKNLWEDICNLIIRPQRNIYDVEDALGSKLFSINNKVYQREDIEIRNEREMKIVCSHYQPIESQRVFKRLPCVVYCHGNCGCRIDALNAVQLLLQLNITVFSFDFTGCGLSDGKYVSLGYFEKEDVKAVVQYLRSKETVSRIGLWGRSMGAATSLIQCARDNSLSGVVADSPFTSLEDIIVDLVQSYKSWIPKTAIKVATEAIRKSIQSRANFDILKLRPIDYVKNSLVPALFAHAENDNFIKLKHCQTLFELYAGDKNIITFDGDHNSQRPDFYYDAVATFFYNCLISNDKELDKEKYRPARGLLSWKHNVGLLTKRGRALMESLDHSVDNVHFDSGSEDKTNEFKLKNKLTLSSTDNSVSTGNKVVATDMDHQQIFSSVIVVDDEVDEVDDSRDKTTSSKTKTSRKEFLYNEERISEAEMMQIRRAMIESIKDQMKHVKDENEMRELQKKLREFEC